MYRFRVIRNRHASAKDALDCWLAGSLWGAPIQLGPDTFHVYGCVRSHGRLTQRKWKQVMVEFKEDQIIVMSHRATEPERVE